MSAVFLTKRAHKKSRAGCQTCKTKKIKCDEAKPKCSFCEIRKLSCQYVQKVAKVNDTTSLAEHNQTTSLVKSSTPDRPLQPVEISWDPRNAPFAPVRTATGILSATDLRMMHHYSTYTGPIVALGPAACHVMKVTVPSLAFDNPFLLNGMLGLASLHNQHLLPQSEEHKRQTALYRGKSFRDYRAALATVTKDSKNYEAVLVMALLLVVLASGDRGDNDELTVASWMGLYSGLRIIVSMKIPDGGPNTTTSVGPLFVRNINDLLATPVVPSALLHMLYMDPSDQDHENLQVYCGTLDALGNLYASLRQDELSEPLFIRIISWPSFTPNEFTALVKNKRPRALVICAYYMSFIKLVSGLWWLEGLADRDIRAITNMLGPDWNHVLDVPLEILQTQDKHRIAEILLR
ncbi:putative c6 zinc finger domain protein [Botrytis cinerea BcDW1]|uniref:Putative c6 zinc finger domain protein n=1 Tax=Botryotinia fuckeliana (strain BcDW1) TaxID=1290391 RepID=M7TR84_BOTF1|nr:putative c6 zinc finger domain protein [Botrytis cinerea BcDW1]